MIKRLPFLLLVTMLGAGLPEALDAQEGGKAAGTGAEAFERIKSLTGEWEAPLPKNEVMLNIFRPIAFGTAVLHEEWKNGEQLTATVFYMVGSELRADHFCDYYNQPRYVARFTDPDAIAFELRDSTNLDTHPRHFHATTWRFVDAKHLTQDWEIAGDGKPSRTVRMEFTRTK